MGNLVRAEIFRIFKKKSLWGYLALFTVLLLITALLYFLYMRGAFDGVPKNSEGLRELGFSFVAVIPLFFSRSCSRQFIRMTLPGLVSRGILVAVFENHSM